MAMAQESSGNNNAYNTQVNIVEFERQFLTFSLAHEDYGVDLINVKEILEFENVTRVPMMPAFIAGVINLRGSIIPVVDLALRFGVAPQEKTKRSSIVILEIGMEDELSLEIGIIVDAVHEVVDIHQKLIEATPSFGTHIRTDFIHTSLSNFPI